jgi:polyphenol oxidase
MTLPLIEVPGPAGVRAVFTTRVGGVSTGQWAGLNVGASSGDAAAAVRENRTRLVDELRLDADRVTLGNQVHGTDVRWIDAPTRPGRFTGGLRSWPDGDGLATDVSGIALVVLGADCLPVLLWRTDGTGVAAAHAGWRGLIDGVLANAVTALGSGVETAAAIGPGAGPCCYQVDATLRSRFADRYGADTVSGDAVDLAGAATVALHEAGVGHVINLTECTVCNPDRFYSYRRDGQTGRQAGVIVRSSA